MSINVSTTSDASATPTAYQFGELRSLEEHWAQILANESTDHADNSGLDDFFDLELDRMSPEDAARERVLLPRYKVQTEVFDLTVSDNGDVDVDMEDLENVQPRDGEFGQGGDGIDIGNDDGDLDGGYELDEDTILVSRLPRKKHAAAEDPRAEQAPKKQKLVISIDSSDGEYVDVELVSSKRASLKQPLKKTRAPRPKATHLGPPAPQSATAVPLAAIPKAGPPTTAPSLDTTPAAPDTAKLRWNYKNKFILDLCLNSSLPIPKSRADRERLFNAMIQPELTALGFRNTFEFKKMDSQFGQKSRLGRTGNPTWTDVDWDRIKADQGDVQDKAWRAATAAAVHATARRLGIAMV